MILATARVQSALMETHRLQSVLLNRQKNSSLIEVSSWIE